MKDRNQYYVTKLTKTMQGAARKAKKIRNNILHSPHLFYSVNSFVLGHTGYGFGYFERSAASATGQTGEEGRRKGVPAVATRATMLRRIIH